MNRYTLYCTESQTRKALELGAPIFTAPYFSQVLYEVHNFFVKDETAYYFPTAEQMINWLDEHGFFEISVTKIYWTYSWTLLPLKGERLNGHNFKSRKDATLAAIDAALEYLTNVER